MNNQKTTPVGVPAAKRLLCALLAVLIMAALPITETVRAAGPFKITFTVDGGQNFDKYPDAITGKVTRPSDPSIPQGYLSFLGWYESSSSTTPFDFDTILDHDITLHPVFSDDHLVTFYDYYGSVIASLLVEKNSTVVDNDIIDILNNYISSLAAVGIDIRYWYVKDGSNKTPFVVGNSSNATQVNGNLSLEPLSTPFLYLDYSYNVINQLPVNTPTPQRLSADLDTWKNDSLYSYRPQSPDNTPSRTYYVFDGWQFENSLPYNFADSITLSTKTQYQSTETITLLAKWVPIEYRVVFRNTKAGNALENTTVTVTADNYKNITSPYNVGDFIAGQGVFNGWLYKNGLSYPPQSQFSQFGDILSDDVDSPSEQILDLFASWNTTGYKLTYDTNTGSIGMPTDDNFYAMTSSNGIKAAPYAFVKSPTSVSNEKIFTWWNTKADGTGTTYYPGSMIEMEGSITLYAQYGPSESMYKIVYHPNESGSTDNDNVVFYISAEFGTKYPLALSGIFLRDDKLVIGWQDSLNTNSTLYECGQEITLGNITQLDFYAKWLDYTVNLTLDPDIGNFDGYTTDVSVTRIVANNMPRSEALENFPTLISPDGYYHVGWNPEIPNNITVSATYTAEYLPKESLIIKISPNYTGDTRAYNGNNQTVAKACDNDDILITVIRSGNEITLTGYSLQGVWVEATRKEVGFQEYELKVADDWKLILDSTNEDFTARFKKPILAEMTQSVGLTITPVDLSITVGDLIGDNKIVYGTANNDTNLDHAGFSLSQASDNVSFIHNEWVAADGFSSRIGDMNLTYITDYNADDSTKRNYTSDGYTISFSAETMVLIRTLLSNYTVAFLPGKLEISRAPLIVTPTYDPNPAHYGDQINYSIAYDGFQFNEDEDDDVWGNGAHPSISSASYDEHGRLTNVGSYLLYISLYNVEPPNYDISRANGSIYITVNPKPITDPDLAPPYDQNNPTAIDPNGNAKLPYYYEAEGYHGSYTGTSHYAIEEETFSNVKIDDNFTHVFTQQNQSGKAEFLQNVLTIEYKLSTADDDAYTSTIPQITEVGQYVVNVRITAVEGSNYTGTLTVNVPASIGDYFTIAYHNVTSEQIPAAPTSFEPGDDEITLPTPTPPPTDYTFGGWYATGALTGTAVTKINPTVEDDQKNWDLYAKWVHKDHGKDDGKTFIYIELDSDETKHDYEVGDPLDTDRLIVYAHYTDGSSRELIPGEYGIYPADGDELNTLGNIPVTVTYEEDDVEDSAAYIVNVIEKGATPAEGDWELIYIELNTKNNVKIIYTQGENLDVSNVIVNGYFDNGVNTLYRPLTPVEYTIEPAAGSTLNNIGKVPIVFTYVPAAGDDIDPTESTSGADWRGHAAAPALPAPTADYVVVVADAGYSITYHNITTTEYENIPLAQRLFTDETTATITLPAITRTDYALSWHTDQALTSAAVTAIDPKIEANRHNWDLYAKWNYTKGTFIYIELDSDSVPHDYKVGDKLDTDDLIVYAYYTDGTFRPLEPWEYTLSPANDSALNTTGDIPITVTYTEDGVTDSEAYIVTVTAENATPPDADTPWELIYIELDTQTVKKVYNYGNALDVTNLVVYGYFEKGNGLPYGEGGESVANRIRRVLTADEYTINPAAGSALTTSGNRPVVVTYKRAGTDSLTDLTVNADWRGHSDTPAATAPDADYVVIVGANPGGGGTPGGGGNPGGGGGTTPTPTPTPTTIEDEGPPLSEFPFVDEHIAYVNGYPDGNFSPDGFVTRAEVAMMIYRLSAEANKALPMPSLFTDVDNWSWYSQAVAYLASRKVLMGYPEGTYRPDCAISRAELATILARFQEFTGTDSDNRYADIAGHWAEKNIVSITIRGWVNGYPDGLFHPDAAITRAETVRMINNMLNRRIDLEDIPDGVKIYTDLPVPPEPTHWAYADIVEASNYHDKFTRKANNSEIWEWPVTGPIPPTR